MIRNQSIRDILTSYEFPPRFLAFFASQCAKDAMLKVKEKDRDIRSLQAIDIAERFGNGESFSKEVLNKIVTSAYAAAASYAAASYAAASYAAANAAATSAAAYAASAYAANATSDENKYKDLLFSLIDTRLTKLEKIMILGEIL